MASTRSRSCVRYDEDKGVARGIHHVCQSCGGDMHLLDPLPAPFGSWGCISCRRVYHYGAPGWIELHPRHTRKRKVRR